ncbi:hypothetical protein M8W81_004678 [Salmonella enterica]|nr:hypothetical protein [Salmonella enterica]EJF6007251.1 hypothetical protein [Salmonella enterica]EJF6164708.1 hypothetical protein [Salmonella enterica]
MKPRDDRTAFEQSCRLNLPALLRWLVMMSVLAGSGCAYAANSTYCATTSGSTLHLRPSVSFQPGVTLPKDYLLYQSEVYSINYSCHYGGGVWPDTDLRVTLFPLGDLTPLANALKEAGLKLNLKITDSSDGVAHDVDVLNFSPWLAVGSNYHINSSLDTGPRTLKIQLEVKAVGGEISPGFYAVPPLSAFSLKAHSNFLGDGIPINTTATRIQYVPTCFVKASVDPVVDFGPVINSYVDDSFTLSGHFTVRASVNQASGCGAGILDKPYESYGKDNKPAGKFYLSLPLKVEFIATNNGGYQKDNAIIVKNEDGDENGLQLKIFDDNIPVSLGEIPAKTTVPEGNKLGTFDGNIKAWTVTKQYTATLSQAPGIPVKNGKYRTQVTVKVSYY